jgi:lipoate-protein ligase A
VNDCRLIVDRPASGAWNMAVDEALLADAAENRLATLRLYQWSEPTLSLGYFQRYEDRYQHAASRHVAVVRRQSGGGAILHDCELTYSLSLPATYHLAGNADELYLAVHQAFVDVLTELLVAQESNYQLTLRCDCSLPSNSLEPFLCFQRRARGDLLLIGATDDQGILANKSSAHILGHKILGSAQRRRRGAILQHGSLLLRTSAAAPEIAGLNDLTGSVATADQLAVSLPARAAGTLGLRLISSELPENLRPTIAVLESRKYAASAWTIRR